MPENCAATADIAIKAEQLGIQYRRYLRKVTTLKDAVVGLFKGSHFESFWALRGLDLTVGKGERALRRLGLGRARGVPVQVLGRTSVARGQGVAIVRAGRQILIVSVGDGGVRRLGELEPSELTSVPEGDPDVPTRRPARHLSVLSVVALLTTLVSPSPIHAATPTEPLPGVPANL